MCIPLRLLMRADWLMHASIHAVCIRSMT
jgi:hypothetical protein